MSEQQANKQEAEVPVEPEIAPNEEQLTQEDQENYNKMMDTLSKMNTKISKAKMKLHEQSINNKKSKTDEMTDKLIQSKQSSEIITKENLLADITESYQKVVIEVYSQNSKLKKKIEEMAKIIKEQNNNIYSHSQKEQDLIKQNERLRLQIAKLQDEKLLQGRNSNQKAEKPSQKANEKESTKKKVITQNNQNEDYDFWSMPQNDYGSKKKQFIQNSNLWVNQNQNNESVFLTEEQTTANKKKKY